MHSRLFALAAVLSAAWSAGAHPQSLAGVFSPEVNEGHKSVQYRAAFAPDANAFANRFHYPPAMGQTGGRGFASMGESGAMTVRGR